MAKHFRIIFTPLDRILIYLSENTKFTVKQKILRLKFKIFSYWHVLRERLHWPAGETTVSLFSIKILLLSFGATWNILNQFKTETRKKFHFHEKVSNGPASKDEKKRKQVDFWNKKWIKKFVNCFCLDRNSCRKLLNLFVVEKSVLT